MITGRLTLHYILTLVAVLSQADCLRTSSRRPSRRPKGCTVCTRYNTHKPTENHHHLCQAPQQRKILWQGFVGQRWWTLGPHFHLLSRRTLVLVVLRQRQPALRVRGNRRRRSDSGRAAGPREPWERLPAHGDVWCRCAHPRPRPQGPRAPLGRRPVSVAAGVGRGTGL